MSPKNLFRRALLLATLSTAYYSAHADTLDKNRADKKIRVSIDLAVPPSGMTDASMKPTGSDYDVAVLLAKDLGVALEVVPTVGATRMSTSLSCRPAMISVGAVIRAAVRHSEPSPGR